MVIKWAAKTISTNNPQAYKLPLTVDFPHRHFIKQLEGKKKKKKKKKPNKQ